MHVNYEKAEITFVHDCFLRNLPWINAETACIAILMSPWFSRGWTALELAKSKGIVKVAFRGAGRPLIKDLDDDILAKNGSSNSPRHKLASSTIDMLRERSIQDINDLLTVFSSRHTSWTRDMAIISALLVGANITGKESQQDMYQAVLREVKGLCHAHLFHNLPTISNGWSPASLFNIPRPSAKTQPTLRIGERGEAVGTWKMIRLESIPEKRYVWKDIHPFIAAKLRSCLKLKDEHVLLVEPDEEKVGRAILVKRLEKSGETIQCQFVGSVYFDSPQQLDLGSDEQVIIANVEETEAATQDDYNGNSEMEGCNGKTEDEHNHSLSSQVDGTTPMVQRSSQFQQMEIQMEMRASENNEISEATSASQGEGRYFPRETASSSAKRNEDLLEAAKNGNKEKLRQLIDEGADIGFQDNNRRTPTSWAAEHGYYDVVELLLKQYEVDYDCMDNASQIPLLPANINAENEPKAVVERIIEDFISLYNSKDDQGRTPLLLALKKGHSDVALLLLRWYEAQYKTELKDERGQTPLSWAGRNGYEALVKLLLATGKADVDSRDKQGRTPLSWAAGNGHEASFKLLLATGKSNVDLRDEHGQTPLSWAGRNGHEAVVKLLLATGKVDVNSRNRHGWTPLFVTARNGHEAVVKLLLATGKADVDLRDDNGRTLLHIAAFHGHEAVVKLLLVTGKADVDSKDKHGWTSLLSAARNRHEAVVKLLLATGKVDVNLIVEGSQTPLIYAARNGHEAVVKLLLATGKVDVNLEDDCSWTPLIYAARSGHEAIVKLLLATGEIDVDLRDESCETPLWWARYKRHEAVVKLLQSFNSE